MADSSASGPVLPPDTRPIKSWRSIVTLIVFVLTNICVLFPFHITLYVPRLLSNFIWDGLGALRIISPRDVRAKHSPHHLFVRFSIPINFITAPLIADLFLLAISAIGRTEVHDGTVGADGIYPLSIMAFFLSLAYIAISIDASGLIRYLAFRVLKWGGAVGHRLFFYLYLFFFALGSFIGNDPIILSGTAFLAYMTRVSSNIVHPRAWIHTQFAVANIASAILVSSNPTNLVLAGAFDITFIHYTANIIVPVLITGIVLFPFLLYIVFASETLIPVSIKMHELPEEAKARKPVNPNIPHARGNAEEAEKFLAGGEEAKLLSLEEIMNPFLDKSGAAVGAIIMSVTLIALTVLNAVGTKVGFHQVFWATLPASIIMLCWDVWFGWRHRIETREISKTGRQDKERARLEKKNKEEEAKRAALEQEHDQSKGTSSEEEPPSTPALLISEHSDNTNNVSSPSALSPGNFESQIDQKTRSAMSTVDEKQQKTRTDSKPPSDQDSSEKKRELSLEDQEIGAEAPEKGRERQTLVSLTVGAYTWSQETFPTATTVFTHLPYALIPFALSMFVLVQGLATKGWVAVFAYGWDHWVNRTGPVGAVGGMAFLSVILCNFAGTNIGTTILLSRVVQQWQKIHQANPALPAITNREFWGTVYSMALGVNYGAFSAAFSAALAGLLWRDILARKHIRVKQMEFARVNLPIIAIAMTVGCVVLVAEIYIVRKDRPYTG